MTYREPEDAEILRIVRDAKVAAVVGMKDESRADEAAHYVPARMQRAGIRVLPVNPTVQRALGEEAYPRLADVPDAFDLVVVFRRPEHVPAVAEEIVALPPARRPRVVWLQLGIVSAPAAERLAAEGITVVMDRCFAVDMGRAGRR